MDVLLEFDPKLIWVCGFDRVPGAAVFRLTQGSLTHTLTFGAVNDSTLTVTITVFFRDAAGTVLAARDSIVKIQKSPGLPEPFDSILKTTDWIHRRLNLATYLIFGGALVAVALWLYFNVQMMDQDKREALFIRTHLAPRRYTGSWSELFLIEPTSQSWLGRGDWSAAAQGWYVGHSPAAKRNPGKGLARIANAEWGMPQSYLFNDQQLYDYTVAIRCNLSAPSFNYSWVLRAQSGRPRGYVFTIRKFNQGIRVEGTVKWRFSSAPLIPVHGIDIIRQDCCRSGDYLIFKMQASNYDFKVTSFSLNNDDPNDDRDFVGTEIVDPAKSDAFRFRDGYGSYRYGTLALFAEDPKQGSEVEYVEVLEAK